MSMAMILCSLFMAWPSMCIVLAMTTYTRHCTVSTALAMYLGEARRYEQKGYPVGDQISHSSIHHGDAK